jgi:hypothetical protein
MKSQLYLHEGQRKIRPDYFEYNIGTEKYDLISMYHSTLLEETLQVKDQDFANYYDAIKDFWNELPDCMYTK